jgi:hypothetical protein
MARQTLEEKALRLLAEGRLRVLEVRPGELIRGPLPGRPRAVPARLVAWALGLLVPGRAVRPPVRPPGRAPAHLRRALRVGLQIDASYQLCASFGECP